METLELNHVSLHVLDVPTSVRFYGDLIGLEALPRPAFSFPGAWFRLGVRQELHLIGGREDMVTGGSRSNHFAVAVRSVPEVVDRLRERGLEPAHGPKLRPDGVPQVFYCDPDGHFIEFTEVEVPSV